MQNQQPAQLLRLEQVRNELTEEHRILRSLSLRVQVARDPEDVAALLAELHRRLAVHFLHEEFADGWFEALRGIGPAHQARVRELTDEHAQLLATARRLAARAKGPHRGGTLIAEAHALGERLAAHERRELMLAATSRAAARE